MSQYAAELCTLLVEDNFGDLFGRIYSNLVHYGRLTLARLRDHAQINHKQLLHALAAMVQMQLVHHFTSIEDGMTYYEANVDGAYYLIRNGKFLEVVEERLGSYPAQVMGAIAYHGHIQVSDLEKLPELQVKSQPNGTNHDNEVSVKEEEDESEKTMNGIEESGAPNGDEHTGSNNRLHAALNYLAGHGYICRVRDTHFHSLADNTIEAEREALMRLDSDAKGKKKSEEVEMKKREILNRRLDADLSRGLESYAAPPALKRAQTNGVPGNPAKRRRVDTPDGDDDTKSQTGWDDDDDGESEQALQPNVIVRVNYQKLDVVLRNRRLVELAMQETSPVTANVYETLLRLIEYRTQSCRETVEIPREGEEGEITPWPVTLQRLTNEIDPGLDLAGSIGPPTDPVLDSKKKKKNNSLTNGAISDDYDDHDDVDNSPPQTTRAHDVDQHLNLLALPPFSLCTRRSQGSVPAWYIEYRRLARELRHLEVERIVGIRFGRIALRLIRILLARGKLDEKRLQEISLLSQKDLRQILAQMQEHGIVDLQEIPRDAQRLPSRTVFLWFYDPDRVGRNLLHDTYKAMSRCLQRLRYERNRIKDFLDKTERIDVKENEEKYLTQAELDTLRQWREKEALMLGEVSRLDDLVAVFRDF